MKALSIIGIVLSPILFVLCFAAVDASRNYNTEYGYSYYNNDMDGWGVFMILISLFFLAFSIVACVKAFKKAKNV